MQQQRVQIIECPRDAIQGLHRIIPTQKKLQYIQLLLNVGFDIIDAGSFVNPKLVPQMADSPQLFSHLDLSTTKTKLLAIVGNKQGAKEAIKYDTIHYLGYPFSISPTFLKKNLNRDVETALLDLSYIHRLTIENGKELIIYLSMAFGNPYGDDYNALKVKYWVEYFKNEGIKYITLADTTAEANKAILTKAYNEIDDLLTEIQLSLHLHATRDQMLTLCSHAYEIGFKRFDASIGGVGGCPFAKEELTGNVDTILLIKMLKEKNEVLHIDEEALEKCRLMAMQLFNNGI